MRKNSRLELLIIALWAVVACFAVRHMPAGPIRAVIAAPLVIYFPGRTLLGALLPDLHSAFNRVLLSIGFSLALLIPLGLALNAVNALNASGWTYSLALLTLALASIAFLRPPSAPEIDDRRTLPISMAPLQLASLAGAAILVAAAVLMAGQGAKEQREFAWTDFWLVADKSTDVLTIGISNHEGHPEDYRIGLIADGAQIATWPAVSIGPQANWTQDLPFNTSLRSALRIEAWLYKLDEPNSVYRKVWFSGFPDRQISSVRN